MKAYMSCFIVVLSLPAWADSELDQLRAQNAQLQERVLQLEKSCPTAAAAPAATLPASAAIPPPPATAAVSSPQPAVAPAPVAAAAAPAPAPAPPMAPEGYRLVKIDPAASAEDEENCRHGVFGTTRDAPWKHEENWQALAHEMKPPEVESLLGKNHTAVNKRGRTLWEYGKCGSSDSTAQAYVVFEGGSLLYWQQPDF